MNNIFFQKKKIFILFFVFSLFIFCSLFVSSQNNETETNTTETNTTEVNTTIEITNQTTNESSEENAAIDISNQTNSTEETNTTEITMNKTEENETIINCGGNQCDEECLICRDASCQYPEVGCQESLSLEKISPSSVEKGGQQLNIMVKNTGNVALSEVYAEISGYGVTTIETLPIAILPVGEKDYTFTKIQVETAGELDIIVQIYSNSSLILEEIFSLIVEEEEIEQEEVIEEEFNTTAASEKLNLTWIEYDAVETLYYEKEKDEYILIGVEEDLKQVKEYLRQAQIAIIELNNAGFQANIIRAETTLDTTKNDVERAVQEEKSISQLLVENLTVIGSLLGVIISVITVWSLTKAHLKKARVVNIIKGKQIINIDKGTKVENIVQKEQSDDQEKK